MSDVRIHAPVTIREVVSPRTYRAELPNGKMIFAYILTGDEIPPLTPGTPYSVLLSLCDFDSGRLVPPDLHGMRIRHPVINGVASQASPPPTLGIGAVNDSCSTALV